MSTRTKLLGAFALLVVATTAHAELAVVARGPLYADQKGVTLRAPEGVACSGTALVVADTGNGRLVSFGWKDGAAGEGTELKVAQVTYPVRVQLDSKGNVLVLDRKAKRIARLDPKGTFLGWVDPKGATGVIVGAFKVDSSDNVFVLDLASKAILALDPTGTVTRKVEYGKQKLLLVDIAVDPAGNIYAIDALGGMVWSVAKDGTELKPLSKSLKEMMSFPGYLGVDARGTMYVVDQNGNGIVLLGVDGAYLGRRLAIGWSEGSVQYPAQLCIMPTGEMALADRGNNRVQLFSVTR